MYVFGIVVTTSDETSTGRASDALRAELPDVFPEFVFDFVGQRSSSWRRESPTSFYSKCSPQTFTR
jgi:hypothetical protein